MAILANKAQSLSRWIKDHPDISIAVGLAIPALGLFLPYLVSPDMLIWPTSGLGTDFLHYRWSIVAYIRKVISEYHQFPLWYSSVIGGLPIVGNPSVSIFYPFQLLIAISRLPIVWSFNVLTVFHYWLAGIGAYLLAQRALKLKRLSALVCAFLVMLTPRLSSNVVGDIGLAYAMSWVPLTINWGLLALLQHSKKWLVLAGMALAFQYLLHVQVFFYTLLSLALFVIYQILLVIWNAGSEPSFRNLFASILRWILKLGLIVSRCLGLVAFSLLPFVSYLPYLSRASLTMTEASQYALPPALLTSILMPLALKFPEWEMYVGLLPLVLIPLVLHSKQRAQVGFWFFLALFSVIFSLGDTTPLFTLFYKLVPGVSWLRVPARMGYFWIVSAGVLAGFAIDDLLYTPKRVWLDKKWLVWVYVGGACIFIVSLAGRFFTKTPADYEWMLVFLGAMGMLLAGICFWQWLHQRILDWQFVAGLLIGLVLDLVPIDSTYTTPRNIELAFQPSAISANVIDQSKGQHDSSRFFALQREIPDHIIVAEGLESVDGVNSFQFEHYIHFMKIASGCESDGFFSSVPPCSTNDIYQQKYQLDQLNPTLLGLLNVSRVISKNELTNPAWSLIQQLGEGYIYANPDVLPRAFAIGKAELVSPEDMWQRLKLLNPKEVVLIENKIDAGDSSTNDIYFLPAEINLNSPNKIKVNITLSKNGVLVLSEVWTPGWRAYDNGKPVEVLRVNGALRGVWLSAGFHQVEFIFHPPAFIYGLVITILTVIFSLVLYIRDAMQNNSERFGIG